MMKLIKKVFTKQHLETNIYTTFILISLVLMSFASCTTTIEPLDGLCYNDRDGSYMCPEKEEESERDMEEFEPIYEYCEPWEFDGEAWMNCIMNEESRRNLIRRLA